MVDADTIVRDAKTNKILINALQSEKYSVKLLSCSGKWWKLKANKIWIMKWKAWSIAAATLNDAFAVGFGRERCAKSNSTTETECHEIDKRHRISSEAATKTMPVTIKIVNNFCHKQTRFECHHTTYIYSITTMMTKKKKERERDRNKFKMRVRKKAHTQQ